MLLFDETLNGERNVKTKWKDDKLPNKLLSGLGSHGKYGF